MHTPSPRRWRPWLIGKLIEDEFTFTALIEAQQVLCPWTDALVARESRAFDRDWRRGRFTPADD